MARSRCEKGYAARSALMRLKPQCPGVPPDIAQPSLASQPTIVRNGEQLPQLPAGLPLWVSRDGVGDPLGNSSKY